MPGYLQFLALESIVVFRKESVNVAIFEVHAGGLKDAINIFGRPLVCGFTIIGLEYAELLGGTTESVAEHKSGIMRCGRPVFSIVQSDEKARKALESKAETLDTTLEFIEINAELPAYPTLKYTAQKQNASLAIQLFNTYLSSVGGQLSKEDIIDGISRCK